MLEEEGEGEEEEKKRERGREREEREREKTSREMISTLIVPKMEPLLREAVVLTEN